MVAADSALFTDQRDTAAIKGVIGIARLDDRSSVDIAGESLAQSYVDRFVQLSVLAKV